MGVLQLQQRLVLPPQYAAPIDYQGLGRGLKLLFNPALGSKDLVTGRTWAPGGNASVVTARTGKAFQFDGVDDHYSYTGYPEISGAAGTFFMYCPVVGPADNFGTVFFSDTPTYLWLDNLGRIYAWSSLANGGYTQWFNSVNRSIIFTSDGTPSGTRIYVDGSHLDSVSFSGSLTGFSSSSKALRFGAYANGNAYDFNGQAGISGYSNRKWTSHEASLFHGTRGGAIFKAQPSTIWLVSSAPAGDTVGTASGSSTASGIGASISESTGSSSGTSTASGVGSSGSVSSSTGTAAGTSTASATGASVAESVGSSSGLASASGIGVAEVSTVGAAAGTSTVSGVGVSATGSSGTASGSSTANASGSSTAASNGTVNGVAAASGIGASVAAVSGSASGLATVAGVGDSIIPGSATGTASGTSTASAIGASIAASTGSASGDSTATGKGSSTGGVVESYSGGYLYVSREEREEIKRKQRIKLGIIEEEKPNLEKFEITELVKPKKKLIPARQQKKIDQEALNTELKALLKKQIQIEEELEEQTILKMLMEL